MAFFIPSSDSIVAGTAFSTSNPGDELIVREGITQASTNTTAVYVDEDAFSLRVDGEVIGGTYGVRAESDLTTVRISVGETGRLLSFESDSGNAGILMASPSEIYNLGEIAAQQTIAILAFDGAMSLANGGTISGTSGVQFGVISDSDRSSLTNWGTIVTHGVSSAPALVYQGRGVNIEQSDVEVVNQIGGRIISTMEGGTGIFVSPRKLDTTEIFVSNDGEIAAPSGTGVDFAGLNAGAASSFYNGGIVTARIAAFSGGSNDDDVVNSGQLNGAVFLGGGDDSYRNQNMGITNGVVSGDAGNDTLIGAGDEDTIEGGNGDDRLFGRAADDDLTGGGGNDRIFGQDGEDDLLGQAGFDLMYGGRGDDTMAGGTEADTMQGGAGDDLVSGNGGFDLLDGGRGDDTLTGDDGTDTVNGGKGEDEVYGGSGSDNLAGGYGDDLIAGGPDGYDTLTGGPGNDTLDGGTQADTLTGGKGDDTIITGLGYDTVVFRPGDGTDLVVDMVNAQDRIDLRAWNLIGFADLQSTHDIVGLDGAVRIDFANGDMLILDGLTLAQTNAADFLF